MTYSEKGVYIIYTLFNKLTKEKQQVIMNAAISEFVQSGFDKSSTNEIVKRAKISKGSLFNYFTSKKDLYFYVIDYGVQIINYITEQIDLTERDLFQRIENVGLQKMYIQQKNPQVFDFLASTKQEESHEVSDIINQKLGAMYDKSIKKLYEGIDYTKFRDDIDIEKAIEILNWTMFGFGEKGLHQMRTFENVTEFGEHYLNEWKQYAHLLKTSFYKEWDGEIR